MERDLKVLDELFDSIIEEIKDPKSAAEHRHTLDLSVDKNGLGFSEAVSVIKVNISEDKMTAYAAVIAGGANPRRQSYDDIIAAIKAKGVVYGIDEEAVRSLSDGGIYDRSVTVARGSLPTDGKDGYTEPCFDCSGGKEVKNIDIDTVVCRVIPPENGVDGRNVLGETLPARDGEAVPDMAGENIVLIDGELKTQASGTLALRNGQYSIINEMIIDNDVNATMGVVSFAGTIIIRGNVRDKSVIRAGNSIVVMGYAFGAVIEAGADVSIAKSTENCVIIAKNGSVKCRDVTASAVSAGAFIEAASMHDCKVKAITGIDCTMPSGAISGGEIECVGAVSCLILGTRRRDLTLMRLGDDGEYVQKLANHRRQLKFVQSELDKVNRRIEKLEEEKKSGDISLDDENFLVAAVTITAQLGLELEQAEKRIQETEAVLELSKKAMLTVKTIMYANVAIQIRGQYLTTETDKQDVVVSENQHGIVVT